jgi:uncharacterized membrane protein
MARGKAAALAVFLLIVQPALALASREAGPEGPPEGRFVPPGTVVLFDEAHFPVYTVNPDNPDGYKNDLAHPRGAYKAFASVLENAGMTVKTLDYGYYLDSNTLAGVKVLVIVCSQGESRDGSVLAPYTADETESVLKFVRNGGGLFLIGDHTTFPPAIFPVAEKFGITYAQKKLQDPSHNVSNQSATTPSPSDTYDDRYSFIYFERSRGNFGDSPIMNNISRVELYRTDYFSELPDEAVPLITTDADTYYAEGSDLYPQYIDAPSKVVAAAIPSNTTAGAGRVVVVADTNSFETDENRDDDEDMDLFDSDNELYGLQIVEWLADVPVHRAVDLYSAEPGTVGERSLSHNVTAGAATTFNLRLENAGNIPDTYDISALTTAPGWVFGLGFSDAQLKNSEARGLNLTVRAPADASVGDGCTITVTARSRQDPLVNRTVECRAVVPQVHLLALGCPKNRQTIESGESARYELWVQNRGNVRERVQLETEPAHEWGAALDAGLFDLDPGRERYFNLTVAHPPEALGGDEGAVAVVARSADLPSVWALNTTYTLIRQHFALELSSPFPELRVDPGSLASFPVTVSNRGNGDDEVTLSLLGGSRWTTYIEPGHFLLPFNSSLEAAVVTRAPAGSPANDSTALIALAVPVKDQSAQDRLALRATVNSIAKLALAVDPPSRYVDPGASGQFDVTVTNTGNTCETVRLTAEEPGVLSPDSAVVPMGRSASSTLSVAVPQNARAWSEILVSVEAFSERDPEVSRHAIATVVVNQVHKIRGALTPPEVRVLPGSEGTADLGLWNEGNGPDVASCSVEGAPPGWTAAISPGLVELDYLGYGRTVVTVAVPPGAPAGPVDLTVTVSDGAGRVQSLPLVVEVRRVHNFTAAVMPDILSAFPGKRVDFTLLLTNLGNSAELLSVAPAGKRARWVAPESGKALVNRSSGRELVLHVRSDQDTPPGKYLVNVTVTGGDGMARQVSFYLRVKEGTTTQNDLPCWIGAAIVLGAVGAALLVRRRILQAQKEAELEKEAAGPEAGEEEPAEDSGRPPESEVPPIPRPGRETEK